MIGTTRLSVLIYSGVHIKEEFVMGGPFIVKTTLKLLGAIVQ